MSIASAIQVKQQQVADSYTAVSNKGGTLPATQNLTNLATAISSIPSGSTPSGTTDVPLTRISDDNGNEIGTWFMNFEDANGNMYKVVLLDAQYRNASAQWCSDRNTVTNMPRYSDLKSSNVFEAKETATQNTQLILDYCTSGGYTSSACSHCRSQSFTINGVTYKGQLPNMMEIILLAKHYNEFDVLDTSSSTYTSTNFSSSRYICSSSQNTGSNCWRINITGYINGGFKTISQFVCPVLEIPNT